MNKTTGKVTIDDIATLSGVSKTTVSRYLNGKYNMMSAETRHRIETAVRLSNYQPSAVARSLKTQKSYLIGAVVSDITSPFSSALISGIGDCLYGYGYIPVFTNSGDSPDREQHFIHSLLSHQVDGLVVNTAKVNNPYLINLANSGVPIVLVDRCIDNYNFDIVTGDYKTPIRNLLVHLRQEGYGRAVLFSQEYQENSVRMQRVEGFYEADREVFGRARPADDLCQLAIGDTDRVCLEVKRVLESTPRGNIPALIGNNSVTLMNLVYAISELGLSIPDQVGICGPDDWDWSRSMHWDWSEIIGDGITTYKVHPYQIGKLASELILRRIENPDGKKEKILVPTEMTIRHSTMLRESTPREP